LTQRTWFITGVNSGFGLVATELLLRRGDRVAGTARTLEQLDSLKAQHGDRLWLTSLDVTDTPAIRTAVDAAFENFGHIDVILNNAGYTLFGAAEELTDEQITHQLNTNFVGSIQVVRAALPHLRAQGGGRILQMSSMGAQIAYPGLSLYHASKWAIEGFFEATSQDIAPFHIQTTMIEPGSARTAIFDAGRTVHGPALAAYAGTPARATRELIEGGSWVPPGDPVKMMQAMIDSVELREAPKRLALGSDAYTMIHEVLTKRLEALEAQKEIALAMDADA
jgi:NAD(P)-dependent dehydrogenase (short-subunit alcohol dehydrogenase family)